MSKQLTPKQLAEQEAERLAEQKRSNEAARAKYLQSLETKKQLAEQEREARRVKESEKLKNDLKNSYMLANPTASNADFERDFPSLKAELFKNNTLNALTADKLENRSEYQM